MPLRMTPNFEDLSCEFAFGQDALPAEEDPLMQEVRVLKQEMGCLKYKQEQREGRTHTHARTHTTERVNGAGTRKKGRGMKGA